MPMAVPCLVNDIYPLIYGYLDLPSKAMFALSCYTIPQIRNTSW